MLEMLMTHCCSDRSISDGLAATGMLDVRVQVGMWHVGRTSIRHYCDGLLTPLGNRDREQVRSEERERKIIAAAS
jgi:hypothetical protein